MTFTGDDLRRLKDYLSSPGRKYWGPGLSGDSTEALLTRLEAAELCARFLDGHPASQLAPVEHEALEAWRKATGK